jgi:hypothetical protein
VALNLLRGAILSQDVMLSSKMGGTLVEQACQERTKSNKSPPPIFKIIFVSLLLSQRQPDKVTLSI